MDLFPFNSLTVVGLLLVSGYWAGRLANRLGLPRISGYLSAGILLGPSLLGLVYAGNVGKELEWITQLSLCLIGYSIGGSLEYKKLRHLGHSIVWITLFQAIGAFAVTFVAMFVTVPLLLLKGSDYGMAVAFSSALILGAISVATAPGAVLAVVSETRSRGPFTNTLLGVVALDDGVTLIIFAVAAATAKMIFHKGGWDGGELMSALWELGGSITVGVVAGNALKWMGRSIYNNEILLMITLGVLCLVAGISPVLHVSSILSSMVAGAFIVNFERRHNHFFKATDQIEATVYGLFFSLAGAHVDFGLFLDYFMLSLLLLVARFVGKQAGVWLGAAVTSPSESVRRYLGIALFPQAGVTIGLVLLAESYFPESLGAIVVNFVVGAVIINEIISPPLLKLCLKMAGETEE